MSYLALARKWRPNTFQQVVGQSHVLTALGNALSHNRLHHAYLFSGTRGVGKTSIGRLFAKGLNCETGITATPCGECDTCREIDQGRFVDLLEIDAASRTKVEDTRDLLDNVQYKPARGRFKVYLIDEVHMLSRHSFNALLKTLEEPPEYVKFLLATTDPQKLPVTILSRCLQFHLKPISVDDIHHQLEHILEQESISAEPRALGLLAHAADGSMRDALSLTDQAIALGNGHIEASLVRDMLGTIDTDQAIHLLEAISGKQAQMVVGKLAEFAQNGIEWDGLLQELAAQLHRIAMHQALPSSLDRAQPDAERIELLSRALTPQDVQLYYQIALKGRDDLALAPSGRVAMEMIALRMLAFRPAQVEQAHSFRAPANSAAVSPAATLSATQSVSPQATQVATQPALSPSQTAAPAQYGAPTTYPQSGAASPVTSVPHDQDNSSMAPPAYLNEGPQYGQSVADASSHAIAPTERGAMSNPSPNTPSEPTAPVEATRTPSAPAPKGLRHQLRSQRQQKQQGSGGAQSGDGKKSNTASVQKESVLARIAQKHASASQVLSTPSDDNGKGDNEPYQWRPVNPVVQEASTELTPTEIKQALEHEKTPEMTARLIDESLQQNDWARLISEIDTSKLVEQLALNSAFEQSGNTISLTLRAHQAHLNTDRAQSELLSALNQKLGQECVLSVEVGESGETPLELRERLYQQHLQQAFHSLEQDPTVQFIQRRFSAQLDRDSVRPI